MRKENIYTFEFLLTLTVPIKINLKTSCRDDEKFEKENFELHDKMEI